jgi:amino acid transporter
VTVHPETRRTAFKVLMGVAIAALGFAIFALSGSVFSPHATIVDAVVGGYLVAIAVAVATVAALVRNPESRFARPGFFVSGAIALTVAAYALANSETIIALTWQGSPPSRQGHEFGISLLILGPAFGLAALALGIVGNAKRRRSAEDQPSSDAPLKP